MIWCDDTSNLFLRFVLFCFLMIWIIVWNFRKLSESSANQSDPLGFSKSRDPGWRFQPSKKKVGPNGFIFKVQFVGWQQISQGLKTTGKFTWQILKIKKTISVYQGNSFFFWGGNFPMANGLWSWWGYGTSAKDGGELARVSCEVGGDRNREVAGGGHPFEIWRNLQKKPMGKR